MVSEESKLYAVLGILLTIIGYIIVKVGRPKDDYALYYAKQGLTLGIIGFVIGIIFSIINLFLGFIPVIGFILSSLFLIFSMLVYLGLTALWIVGIVYSLSEKKKEIPIIGQVTKSLF